MPALDSAAPPEIIAEGCIRISLPDPFVPGVTSVFVIGSKGSPWLVDTGADTPECEAALRGKLAGLGFSLESLPVILSHAHLDHAGGLLRYEPSEITAHARALDEMREPHPRSSRGPMALRRMGLADAEARSLAPGGEPIHGRPFAHLRVDRVLTGETGELPDAEGWQWLLAEGHAPGHLMLFDPNSRTLLAADQFLHKWKTPLIVSDPEFDSLGAYLDSIRLARRLEPDRICSSHMETMPSPGAWLDETEASIGRRLGRVAEAVTGGSRSADQVLRSLYPKARGGQLRIVFLREILAMLRHLASEGELVRTERAGIEEFQRA
jgi:glyoxylase-like metal-dependent hydrolase (beta-lactamase superfamily II)